MNQLTEDVKEYFELRGLKFPDVWRALAFLDTEKAEALELLLAKDGGWTRNNPENKAPWDQNDFADELGDIIMMAIVTGLAEGVDPIEALEKKMDRKLAVSGKFRKRDRTWEK